MHFVILCVTKILSINNDVLRIILYRCGFRCLRHDLCNALTKIKNILFIFEKVNL